MHIRLFVFIVLSLFAAGLAWSQDGQEVPVPGDSPSAETRSREEIHQNYVQLWTGLASKLNRWAPRINHQTTKEAIERTLDGLRSGAIQVKLYSNPDEEWIKTITHSFDAESEELSLWVSHQLLDSMEFGDHFALSRLVHEAKHLSDYLLDFDKMVQLKDNTTEQFLYEMDALFVEAVFNREVARYRSESVGPYIEFLVSNLDTDNLAGAAVVFSLTDMNFVYDAYDIRLKAQTEEEARAGISHYLDQGRTWLASEETEDHWQNLLRLVSLRSWDLHAQTLVGPLLTHIPPDELDTLLEEINELKANIGAEVSRVWDPNLAYRNQIYSSIFERE